MSGWRRPTDGRSTKLDEATNRTYLSSLKVSASMTWME